MGFEASSLQIHAHTHSLSHTHTTNTHTFVSMMHLGSWKEYIYDSRTQNLKEKSHNTIMSSRCEEHSVNTGIRGTLVTFRVASLTCSFLAAYCFC